MANKLEKILFHQKNGVATGKDQTLLKLPVLSPIFTNQHSKKGSSTGLEGRDFCLKFSIEEWLVMGIISRYIVSRLGSCRFVRSKGIEGFREGRPLLVSSRATPSRSCYTSRICLDRQRSGRGQMAQ